MRLLAFSSESDWLEAALSDFLAAAAMARKEGRKRCAFCVGGGTTPASFYRLLASSPRVASALAGLEAELWLSDEREVDPADPARNGRLLADCLGGAPWKPSLRAWPEGAALPAAASYAAQLAASLGNPPLWDLALLGLGSDGHTASLFPGDPVLDEELALAATSRSPLPPHGRMSLTYPALRGARAIRFLVRGRAKAAVVEALARGEASLPAARLDGEVAAILYWEAD